MQYKGYDVELVETRWRNYTLQSSISHDRLLELKEMIGRKDVLFDDIHYKNPLTLTVFRRNFKVAREDWWQCVQSFSTYEFSVLSTQNYSILREAIDCERAIGTFGPETDFWENVLKCKDMSKQGDICGVFITAWAVAHTSIYTEECGMDAGPDEWELIGLLNPDFTISEVGYSWGQKPDPYNAYVMGEMCENPHFALNDYLCGFDFPSIGGW